MVHTPLIPALSKQRQVNLYEFKAKPIYIKFQASQGYTVKPCLKKQDRCCSSSNLWQDYYCYRVKNGEITTQELINLYNLRI